MPKEDDTHDLFLSYFSTYASHLAGGTWYRLTDEGVSGERDATQVGTKLFTYLDNLADGKLTSSLYQLYIYVYMYGLYFDRSADG
jgi:hypothetical protein